MSGSNTPPTQNVDGEAEWASSPIYQALSARISKTETTLGQLSSQVAELTRLVKSSLPAVPPPPPAGTNLSVPPPTLTFAPFDDPPSPFVPPTASAPASGTASPGDPGVALLSQQIAALSTSVAQLQRLQQQQSSSQASLSRQNTNTGPIGPLSLGGLPNGNRNNNNNNNFDGGPGPLTTPGAFQSRPPISRSVSSSVVPPGNDSDKWSSSKHGGGLGLAGRDRDREPWPSPGILTPSISGPSLGVATPGAGIVITKWDHLNLKVELLRSIAKYGIGPPNKIQARVLPFMLKGSDIIAQAPPTLERIISYVVPALQVCLTTPPSSQPQRGPIVIIITTTVDQATQCHKLIRNVGGPLGLRSALVTGVAGSSGIANEIAQIQRDAVHVLIGTPAKLNEVMSGRSISGGECRLLILDEVDQLIARNLYENVLNIAKLLPPPKRSNGAVTPGGPFSPGAGPAGNIGPIGSITSPYDPGHNSPFNPASKTPFPSQPSSRFGTSTNATTTSTNSTLERQTCIFSNTVPTDVINFSQSLNIRDPVRVLVRREGGPNSQESVSSITPGINLKHTYVYLTITGSARTETTATAENGVGTIGSGRTVAAAGGQQAVEEANKAKEYKLDILCKILDDYPLWQAVIHVGTFAMLEAVVYKLQSRSWETLYLAPDMPPSQKKAVLQQWRVSLAGNGPRFLVVFDVNVKPPDIPWSPLVINFDLPRSVEGYAHRASAAVPPTSRGGGPQVHGVIVSFVQAAGGDVEMLRSTECAYRFKSAEIPSAFRDLFQH